MWKNLIGCQQNLQKFFFFFVWCCWQCNFLCFLFFVWAYWISRQSLPINHAHASPHTHTYVDKHINTHTHSHSFWHLVSNWWKLLVWACYCLIINNICICMYMYINILYFLIHSFSLVKKKRPMQRISRCCVWSSKQNQYIKWKLSPANNFLRWIKEKGKRNGAEHVGVCLPLPLLDFN